VQNIYQRYLTATQQRFQQARQKTKDIVEGRKANTLKYFSQLRLSTLPPDSMRNIDLILQGPLQDHLGVSTSMLRIC
jgi:hypothetical protein